MGNHEILDSMIVDGLWCSFEQCHMGRTAGEVIAAEYHIGRAAQDEFAVQSHCKAAAAQAAGRFKAEMLPVAVPQKKGDAVVIDRDESVRADTTVAALGALRPAFRKDGTVSDALAC